MLSKKYGRNEVFVVGNYRDNKQGWSGNSQRVSGDTERERTTAHRLRYPLLSIWYIKYLVFITLRFEYNEQVIIGHAAFQVGSVFGKSSSIVQS